MKDQNEKKRQRRAPQKPAPTKDISKVESPDELTTTYAVKSGEEPQFPDEWISIAAYYIWKSDGEPEGRDAEYWERAKKELRQLQKEGNVLSELRTATEER